MQQTLARPPGLAPYPFYVHERDDVFISERIRKRGVWEPFESRLLLSLLQERDQVLDVGANIGWYTVSAARRVGASGGVFAFEPDPANFSILRANISLGDLTCVRAEPVALGSHAGTASIVRSADNQGDTRVRSFVADSAPAQLQSQIPVASLDAYLAGQPRFAIDRLRIVKLDVQGFEFDVLSGARELLANLPQRAVCFVEFDPALLRENGADACAGFVAAIAALKREVFAICRPMWRLRRMSVDELHEVAGSAAAGSLDLIVAHRSALADLRRALPVFARLLSRRALAQA